MSAAITLLGNDIPADPPAGYEPVFTGEGFNLLFGALYGLVEAGRLVLGFRVSHRHVNPHETCHGGVLSTFADLQGYAAQREAGLHRIVTPTVSMTIDYLQPARLGDWIEARTQLLRRSRTLLFSQTVASVDDRKVFRSSSIFKIGKPEVHRGSTLGDSFKEQGSSAA